MWLLLATLGYVLNRWVHLIFSHPSKYSEINMNFQTYIQRLKIYEIQSLLYGYLPSEKTEVIVEFDGK